MNTPLDVNELERLWLLLTDAAELLVEVDPEREKLVREWAESYWREFDAKRAEGVRKWFEEASQDKAAFEAARHEAREMWKRHAAQV